MTPEEQATLTDALAEIEQLKERLRKINEIVDHFDRPFVSISPVGEAEIQKLCDLDKPLNP